MLPNWRETALTLATTTAGEKEGPIMSRSYIMESVQAILVVALVIIAGSWVAAPAARSASTPALATPAASATGTDAAEVAKGKRLFEANCAVCHKANGSGGVKLGTATSADLRAPDLEQAYHNDDALVRRAILDGKDESGEALDPVMPRWRGRVSRQDVKAIIAFLKTLHK